MIEDLKYAVRTLRKSPGFAVAAILSLALGLGANTALFSAVDAVLLRPLPYPQPEKLVLLYTTSKGFTHSPSAIPDLDAYRTQSHSFAGIAGFYTTRRNLALPGAEPERVLVERTTHDFARVLGVAPESGRYFDEGEQTFGNHRVIVLSHRLAAKLSAKEGATLLLDGEPSTIIGVMPASFDFDDPRIDAWAPISYPAGSEMLTRSNHFVYAVARLGGGASLESANAEISRIAKSLAEQFPENAASSAAIEPLRESIAGELRPALLLLLGAVGLVLLIACANLANLLLARGTARSRELAVRAAMGATRNRLLRQLLTESLVLAIAGGALGVVFAIWALGGISTLGGAVLSQVPRLQLDLRVLSFTLLLSTATGLGFGLLPALMLSHTALADVLKESAASLSPKSSRLRSGLVVAEIALSLLLLTSAALLLRTLSQLRHVDNGFSSDRILTANVALPRAVYATQEKQVTFMHELVARSRALPGVIDAGASTRVPVDEGGWGKFLWALKHEPQRLEDVPGCDFILVSGGDFFRAMGMHLLRGRFLDDPRAQEVVLNQTAARKLFGEEDPIGQQISIDPPAHLLPPGPADPPYKFYTVAGVVRDIQSQGPGKQVGNQLWIRQEQIDGGGWSMYLVLRGSVSAASVREMLRGLDSTLALYDVKTMEERIGNAVSGARFAAFLLALFAVLALVLAMLGVYAVMAYSVEQRTREIGIRMAMGAASSQVARMVMRQGFALVAGGLVLGTIAALLSSRALESLLYEVSPTDPLTYAAVAGVQVAVALAALYLPARRAAKLHPSVALRHE